ncbi:hypothetical protein SLEP1_g57484 [Rubroshorea leprosula]|uniref:Uncharacterized protein n=1 Tax=Rubroshorea leprosula TaxID=152421 RepID=A0AAV5MNU0_9ROSI|nr:hypothetical protein SLEP1_g57484 [Rubroshorea leprosula]
MSKIQITQSILLRNSQIYKTITVPNQPRPSRCLLLTTQLSF